MIRRETSFAIAAGHGIGLVVLCLATLIITSCSPHSISPLAIGVNQEKFTGRYMGGGKHFGEGRRPHEGTWARDYGGLDFFHLIEPRWSHDRTFKQGGLEGY